MVGAFYNYGIGYYSLPPEFLCTNDGVESSCLEDDYCSNKDSSRIFWAYDSWTKRYNVVCDDRALRNQMSFLLIFISSFIQFFMSYLQDYFGRRTLAWLFTGTMVFSGLLMLVIPGFILKMVFLGFAVGSLIVQFNSYGVIMSEITSK